MRRAIVGAVALALVAAAVYAGWRALRDDERPVDRELAAQLDDVGLTLYLPKLRGWRLERTRVAPEARSVDLRFHSRGDIYAYSLTQRPAVEGDLCKKIELVDPGGSCSYADGVMRYTFEEMSAVAVLRGDTLLVANGLVTEVDPELLDEAVEALQQAPEVSSEELARSGSG